MAHYFCPKCKINYKIKTPSQHLKCIKCNSVLQRGKVCTVCGAINVENAIVCDLCGNLLVTKDNTNKLHITKTNSLIDKSKNLIIKKKICSNGHINDSNAIFCKICGKPIVGFANTS